MESESYFNRFFDPLWRSGLSKLVTCGNIFSLNQCELSPRYDEKNMQRNTRYHTDNDLIADMRKKHPAGLQMGAIFPRTIAKNFDYTLADLRAIVKQGHQTALGPLVIDIDITDYGSRIGICQCGERDPVCQLCWDHFIEPAREVTHYLLQSVWQFKKVLTVFSGKKGVHFWIYDERVLVWTDEQRTTFINSIRNRPPRGHEHHIYQILLKGDESRYPKFDANVTKQVGHLKGLPLTIHHKTGYFRIILKPGAPFQFRRDCLRPSGVSLNMMLVFLVPINKLFI